MVRYLNEHSSEPMFGVAIDKAGGFQTLTVNLTGGLASVKT